MPDRNRLPALQYLRAMAAMAVVALHAGSRVQEDLPDPVWAVVSLGHAGVDLFFVISGFIMWTITRDRPSTGFDFLVRRLVRIAPPYWIATIVWIALSLALGYEWVVVEPEVVAKSLLFIPHFNANHPDQIWPVLIPGWTLQFEMFFYLAVASTLVLGRRQRLPVLSVGLIFLVIIGALLEPGLAWTINYTSPLLLEFLIGCLVAELWHRRLLDRFAYLVALFAGVILFAAFAVRVDPDHHMSRVLGYGAPSALFLLGVVGLGSMLPPWSRAEATGDASYAIYLFHLMLIQPMASVWLRVPEIHSGIGALAFVLIAVVASCHLGGLVYRYVECPILGWLHARLLEARGGQTFAK